MSAPTPGIYPGVPMPEYLGWEADSYSVLKHVARSPLHARAAMLAPDTDATRAMLVGEALDCGLLTPSHFPLRYGVPPKVDRRTKDGKAEYAAWEEAHPQFVALTAEEYEAVEGMLAAVQSHEFAAQILGAKGANQISIAWRDPESGILCKGRPDAIRQYAGYTWVVDVKTTADASPDMFARICSNLKYHWQAAMYVDGLNVLRPHSRRFIHVVIESKPPHGVAIYELTDEAVQQGRDDYRAALRVLKRCRETNTWPGYPSGIEPLDLPRWAQRADVVEEAA